MSALVSNIMYVGSMVLVTILWAAASVVIGIPRQPKWALGISLITIMVMIGIMLFVFKFTGMMHITIK